MTSQLSSIIRELGHRKTAIDRALEALREIDGATAGPSASVSIPEPGTGRKKFSAATRRKMKAELAPETEQQREALLARLKRVVVGIDPSGCAGESDSRSDEVGIVVVGLGNDGVARILEDATGRYSPNEWAHKAMALYDRWRADKIVAEKNHGGAMVESTIRTARRTAPVKLVNASRGKVQRAEPVAALYDQGKVRHIGQFPELERQYCRFSTGGYVGEGSPDRADAAIWALTELMLDPDPVPGVRFFSV